MARQKHQHYTTLVTIQSPIIEVCINKTIHNKIQENYSWLVVMEMLHRTTSNKFSQFLKFQTKPPQVSTTSYFQH